MNDITLELWTNTPSHIQSGELQSNEVELSGCEYGQTNEGNDVIQEQVMKYVM